MLLTINTTSLLLKKVVWLIKRHNDDYHKRTADDEAFVNQVETGIDKMWETDLADWEFSYKGIEDWTQKLQSINS